MNDPPDQGVSEVVVLFVIALMLLVMTGAAVGGLPARLGMAAQWATLWKVGIPELVGLLLPAVLFLWRKNQLPLLRQLLWPEEVGRVRVVGRQLAAGLLLGVGLFYFLAAWLEPLYERLVPLPLAEQQALQRMIAPKAGLRPLWLDVLTFALLPAVCEELLFRGAILGSLIGSGGGDQQLGQGGLPWRAFADRRVLGAGLLSALLFGMIHLSWGRLIPTMLLGMAFAAAVLRSGGLWAAMTMHAVNNSLVVLLVRRGLLSVLDWDRLTGPASLGISARLLFLPVAVVATVAGLALLANRPRPEQSSRSA